MSVLKSLKGTFQNVQQGITAGLATAFTAGKVRPPPKDKRLHGINLDAGADLLNKFQQDWVQLHDDAEENAAHAQDVDSLVSKLYLEVERQNDMMTALTSELSQLPQYLKDLQHTTDMIASIEGTIEDMESQLVHLEDLMEQLELQTNKQHHHTQLHFYRQKKYTELETLKVDLAQDHARKVQEVDARRQRNIKDKQEALQEVFADEMDYYKRHGKLEREGSMSSGEHMDIGDVALDEGDQSELDAFLDEDAQAAAATTPAGDDVAPAGDATTPAGDTSTPVGDTPTPSVATTPVGDTVPLAGDATTPAGDTSTPVGDTPTPAVATTPVGDITTTPKGDAPTSVDADTSAAGAPQAGGNKTEMNKTVTDTQEGPNDDASEENKSNNNSKEEKDIKVSDSALDETNKADNK